MLPPKKHNRVIIKQWSCTSPSIEVSAQTRGLAPPSIERGLELEIAVAWASWALNIVFQSSWKILKGERQDTCGMLARQPRCTRAGQNFNVDCDEDVWLSICERYQALGMIEVELLFQSFPQLNGKKYTVQVCKICWDISQYWTIFYSEHSCLSLVYWSTGVRCWGRQCQDRPQPSLLPGAKCTSRHRQKRSADAQHARNTTCDHSIHAYLCWNRTRLYVVVWTCFHVDDMCLEDLQWLFC